MVTNLMMSPKMATLCFLRIRIFWNNVYYVIISIYDFTSKILSRDSNHTVDVVLCSKFCDSSISTREVITNSILQGFDLKKKNFFEAWSWFKFNNLGLALGMTLKFYTSVAKGLRLKVRKFWGLLSVFVEVRGEKIGMGGSFFPPLPPSWIGLM